MALGTTSPSLEVRVDGDVDPYERALDRAVRATQRYERSLESLHGDLARLDAQLESDMAAKADAQAQALDKVGQALITIGAGLAIAVGVSAQQALKWESAWAGVEKTVDGNVRQMEDLEQGLRNLTNVLPASHEEIAAVAEAAGQLGVHRSDIIGFTKVMVDLGETTNLSADEAATALARFMNIMQTAPEDVDRVGAALVDLGNKGASTEAEIIDMALRISGAAASVGASESDVLALANAMSSLGIQAEMGGSAISRTMIRINEEVETGGERLGLYAELAGMTVEEFSRAWQTDAVGALEAFVNGLGKVEEQGGSLLLTLGELQIKEIRERDTIMRLANSGDVLTDSLRNGNIAWRENSALVEEANKRYQTTEAQIQIAKNQMTDMAIDIGTTLLPVLGSLANFIGDLVNGFQALPGPVQSMVGPVGAIAAAVALLSGALMIATPRLAAFNAAVASGNLGPRMQAAGNAMQNMAGVMMGPWGIALGAATVGLTALMMEAGETRSRIEALTGTLDAQTGAITDMTREMVIQELAREGWLDWAKDADVSLDLVARAAMGDADAFEQLNREVDAHVGEMGGLDRMWNAATDDSDQFMRAIDEQRGAVADSRREHNLTKDALGKHADAQEETGEAVVDTTMAVQDEEQAIDALAEALDDLNGVMLEARSSHRDYEQTLDDAIKTLREGKLTFDIHTKAGRENQAALDAVAQSALRHAEANLEVDASGRKSLRTLQQARKDLMELAQRFGMTREEARDYVDQVLQIPTEWKTSFEQPGMEKAQRDAVDLRAKIEDVPPRSDTEARFATQAATADINNFVSYANDALGRIQDEPVTITLTSQANKVMDTLARFSNNASGFAGGGPVKGPGGPTDDQILARLSAGEHVITADEVRKAGGHGVIMAFRRAAARGELPRENRIPRVGELPAFALGGPVDITPEAAGSLAALAAVERLVEALGSRTGSLLSGAASRALTAMPGGSILGFRGNMTPAGLVRGASFAQSQVGKPYIWGGVGPNGYDCSGAVSAVLNAALGRYPYQRLGSTATMPWAGMRSGVGLFSGGWFTGSPGHMAGQVGGLPFESAGGVGFRTGSSASGVMSFPRQAYYAGYDEGGTLKPGWTLAVNRSGRNEHVITQRQWNKIDELIEVLREKFGRDGDLVKAARELRHGLQRSERRADRLETMMERRESRIREFRGEVTAPFRDTSGLFDEGASSAMTFLRAQRNDARRMRRALSQARRRGLSGGLFTELATSGNYAAAQEVAGMSRREIAEFERLWSERNRAVGRLGTFAGRQYEGPRPRELRDNLVKVNRTLDKLINRLDKLGDRVEEGAERGTRKGSGDAGRRTDVRRRT